MWPRGQQLPHSSNSSSVTVRVIAASLGSEISLASGIQWRMMVILRLLGMTTRISKSEGRMPMVDPVRCLWNLRTLRPLYPMLNQRHPNHAQVLNLLGDRPRRGNGETRQLLPANRGTVWPQFIVIRPAWLTPALMRMSSGLYVN